MSKLDQKSLETIASNSLSCERLETLLQKIVKFGIFGQLIVVKVIYIYIPYGLLGRDLGFHIFIINVVLIQARTVENNQNYLLNSQLYIERQSLTGIKVLVPL